MPKTFYLAAAMLLTQGLALGQGISCTERCTEASSRSWLQTNNHYADSFVWPVLGPIGPTGPLNTPGSLQPRTTDHRSQVDRLVCLEWNGAQLSNLSRRL